MINARDYNKIKDALEQLEKQLFSDVMSVSEVMTEDGIRIKEVPYGSRETVLEDTSTWAVAIVCLVMIGISILIEHIFHMIEKVPFFFFLFYFQRIRKIITVILISS